MVFLVIEMLGLDREWLFTVVEHGEIVCSDSGMMERYSVVSNIRADFLECRDHDLKDSPALDGFDIEGVR